MKNIDLRSDTVTNPTPEMRNAMATAQVGDDVYGEDPTVNHLQEIVAEMMGKEASLFVPSGTMGNLIAILVHCNRGHEIIVGDRSHIFCDEAGGYAALGGIHPYPLPNQPDGTIDISAIQDSIRNDSNPHHACTRLIALENTHNACGGKALNLEYTKNVCDVAHGRNLLVHLDGARIFNAAAFLGVAAADLASPADSVLFCLSKGLCAPVGSMLCGSKDFIFQANRIRKQLGGGMRQAGILAAAGIVALEQMLDRLSKDHARAHRLAIGIAGIPFLDTDVENQETNMVFFSIDNEIPLSAQDLYEKLGEYGIKVDVVGHREIRLVSHYWINDDAVDQAIDILSQVIDIAIRTGKVG